MSSRTRKWTISAFPYHQQRLNSTGSQQTLTPRQKQYGEHRLQRGNNFYVYLKVKSVTTTVNWEEPAHGKSRGKKSRRYVLYRGRTVFALTSSVFLGGGGGGGGDTLQAALIMSSAYDILHKNSERWAVRK